MSPHPDAGYCGGTVGTSCSSDDTLHHIILDSNSCTIWHAYDNEPSVGIPDSERLASAEAAAASPNYAALAQDNFDEDTLDDCILRLALPAEPATVVAQIHREHAMIAREDFLAAHLHPARPQPRRNRARRQDPSRPRH